MTQMRFKSIISLAFITAVMLVPSGVFAADFCSSSDNLSARIAALVSRATNDFDSRKIGTLAEIQTLRAERLSNARDNETAAFDAVISNLLAEAATPSQVAAVKEFKKAASDSMNIRQSAVDDAVLAYNQTASTTLASQENKLEAAFADFNSEVSKVLTNVNAACTSGTDLTKANSAALSALNAAKVKFSAAVAQSKEAKKMIDSLAQKKRLAILRADQDYRGALNAAKRTLKKAFPDSVKAVTHIAPAPSATSSN